MLSKAFQKPWNRVRIFWSVSTKYCSMSIEQTLLMYRACITKRRRQIRQNLTYFRIKKNDILGSFECLQLSESSACCQERRFDCIVALCILFKKLSSVQMQRHGPIIWVKLNWTSFDIYTRFYLSTSVSQTRAMEFFFLQQPYLQR